MSGSDDLGGLGDLDDGDLGDLDDGGEFGGLEGDDEMGGAGGGNVDELGARGASEAIDYYETVGWLTEDVAAELDAHLCEFGPGSKGPLAVEHHRESLEYIDQLNGGDAETQRAVGFDRGGPPS